MAPGSLGLFAFVGIDGVGKVTEELDAFVDGSADAVFVEAPTRPPSAVTFLRALGRAPAYAVGVLLTMTLLYPLYALCCRDVTHAGWVAADRVTTDRDLPVHPVSDHPIETIGTVDARTTAANWLVVAVPLAVDPVATLATATVVMAGPFLPTLLRREGWRRAAMGTALVGPVGLGALLIAGLLSLPLVVVGGIAVVHFAITTTSRRHESELDRVERRSEAEGYDDAVLVAGEGNVGGLLRIARERGIAVPAVHESVRFREGTTDRSPEPSEYPVVESLGDVVETARRTDSRPYYASVDPESVPPSFGRRAGAALVDAVVCAVLWLPVTLLLALCYLAVLTVATGDASVSEELTVAAMLVAWPTAVVGYHALLEWRWGRTAGKRLAGLVVADADGGRIARRQAIGRNALRPLDLLGLYVVGGVFVLATDAGQRPTDLLAGTVVGRPPTDGSKDDGATAEAAADSETGRAGAATDAPTD